jgi:hypothetical protein
VEDGDLRDRVAGVDADVVAGVHVAVVMWEGAGGCCQSNGNLSPLGAGNPNPTWP